jgi:hypothetical protein
LSAGIGWEKEISESEEQNCGGVDGIGMWGLHPAPDTPAQDQPTKESDDIDGMVEFFDHSLVSPVLRFTFWPEFLKNSQVVLVW